ncbi:hypothetical protein FB45DRAFT_898538, partial [Roridomyces roridus]
MLQWSLFNSAQTPLAELVEFLVASNANTRVNLTTALKFKLGLKEPLRSYLLHRSGPLPLNSSLLSRIKYPELDLSGTVRSDILVEEFKSLATTPRRHLIAYLMDSADLGFAPHRYQETLDILESIEVPPPTQRCIEEIKVAISKFVADSNRSGVMETADSVEWMDSIFLKLCSMLWQSQPNDPTLEPSTAIIDYICIRKSDAVIEMLLQHGKDKTLLAGYPTAIAEYPGEPVLCSLWKVLALSGRLYQTKDYEPVLDAVENSGWASSAVTMSVGISVIALLKGQILEALKKQYYSPDVRITSRLLPADTAIQAIDRNDSIIAEALVAHLAEFLAEMPLDPLPYRTAKTIKFLGNFIFIYAGVHKHHQNRLADGLAHIWDDASATHGELLDAVLASPMFDFYTG